MKRIVKIINELIDVKIRIQNQVGAYNKDSGHIDRLNLELELALNEHIRHGSIAQV